MTVGVLNVGEIYILIDATIPDVTNRHCATRKVV